MKFVPHKWAMAAGVMSILLLGVATAQAGTISVLSEKNAAKIVTVKKGTTVELTLHSMYWQLAVPAKSSSLVSLGAPILKPIFPSPNAPHGCRIAGSGCGSQTWEFKATKIGLTHLVAGRTVCGEAMRCTSANSKYRVTIKVIR